MQESEARCETLVAAWWKSLVWRDPLAHLPELILDDGDLLAVIRLKSEGGARRTGWGGRESCRQARSNTTQTTADQPISSANSLTACQVLPGIASDLHGKPFHVPRHIISTGCWLATSPALQTNGPRRLEDVVQKGGFARLVASIELHDYNGINQDLRHLSWR